MSFQRPRRSVPLGDGAPAESPSEETAPSEAGRTLGEGGGESCGGGGQRTDAAAAAARRDRSAAPTTAAPAWQYTITHTHTHTHTHTRTHTHTHTRTHKPRRKRLRRSVCRGARRRRRRRRIFTRGARGGGGGKGHEKIDVWHDAAKDELAWAWPHTWSGANHGPLPALATTRATTVHS